MMLTGFWGFTCGKGTTLTSSMNFGPNWATLPAWLMNIDTRPLGMSSAGSALVATLTVGSEILYLCTYIERTCMAFTPASLFAVHFLPAVSRMLPPYWRVRPSWYHIVQDRKSTRLNSSHPSISYAVFCLKKKTKKFFCNMLKIKKNKYTIVEKT